MSEELLKWLLGGACGAMALVIAVLWRMMWVKDAAIDDVREKERLLREAAVAAREKIIDNQRIQLEEATKQMYLQQVAFEKEHGDTIRKALSIVMAAKHKRPPRAPSAGTANASTQMTMLTHELDGVEVEELLRAVRER